MNIDVWPEVSHLSEVSKLDQALNGQDDHRA
jgi:hypothetical protein